jgi:hypothetical protein
MKFFFNSIKVHLLFLIVTLLIYSLTFANAVWAEIYSQGELENYGLDRFERLNPDSLLYLFKRVNEKVTLLFTKDEEKRSEYQSKLLDRRFKELTYIIKVGKTGFLEEAASRYMTLIGQMKKDGIYAISKERTKIYILVLEKMRDNYPSNTSYWLIIQQAIDTTRI